MSWAAPQITFTATRQRRSFRWAALRQLDVLLPLVAALIVLLLLLAWAP